jgi:hypothetical protein
MIGLVLKHRVASYEAMSEAFNEPGSSELRADRLHKSRESRRIALTVQFAADMYLAGSTREEFSAIRLHRA